PRIRFSPCWGTQRVTAIAARARLRSGSTPAAPDGSSHLLSSDAIGVFLAIEQGGELAGITGLLERQRCGHLRVGLPRAISMPASISALMTASLASPFSPSSVITRLPEKPGA